MKSYRKELWFEVPTRNAMHITASVFINDDESGLHHDYDKWLEKLAPREPVTQYRHIEEKYNGKK